MIRKIVTIGVYGFSDQRFFKALEEAGVTVFCDLRWRRGVRGSLYSFANSRRLQGRLEEAGIHYHHEKALAPTPEVRQLQAQADQAARTAKRKRSRLDPSFVDAYKDQILADYDARTFLDLLDEKGDVIALFCVEREPEACHRSLVAERLGKEASLEVEHLLP